MDADVADDNVLGRKEEKQTEIPLRFPGSTLEVISTLIRRVEDRR